MGWGVGSGVGSGVGGRGGGAKGGLSISTKSLGNNVVATAVEAGVLMVYVFLVATAYSGGAHAVSLVLI